MENNSRTMGWKELFSWYLRSKEWKEQCLRWIQAAYEGAPESSIGKAAAVALYGKELENSATELERFAACAFAHFLQYGLKIEERQEYEFRQADLGNGDPSGTGTVFHEISKKTS